MGLGTRVVQVYCVIYRLPLDMVQKMAQDKEIIEPSDSAWASPIVLVKKDSLFRFCMDFRCLNDLTKK